MARMKLTPMQEAFKKEQNRLKRAIQREYRKTGVELDKDLIPDMPKRVTQKSLREIKSIKPKHLRNESQFVDYETGEILDYSTAKDLWQSEQRILSPITLNVDETIIAQFKDSLTKYNTDFQNKMNTWLDNLINTYPTGSENGKVAVAQMLMEGAQSGVLVTYRMAYSETMLSEYMAEMLDYLPMDVSTKSDILSGIEEQVGFEDIE